MEKAIRDTLMAAGFALAVLKGIEILGIDVKPFVNTISETASENQRLRKENEKLRRRLK